MNLLIFMGEHPVLTFFLACIVGSTVISVARTISGHCDDCHCGKDDAKL